MYVMIICIFKYGAGRNIILDIVKCVCCFFFLQESVVF